MLDVQYAVDASRGEIPDEETIHTWVAAALQGQGDHAELTVRITDIDEITRLNSEYRNKAGATNVLSFPADLPAELEIPLLGDIVICAPVVEKEAQEQQKTLEAHWAHMVVHGTLHLLGYDHIDDADALLMESKETEILSKLGFPDPYQSEATEQ